MTAHPQKLTLTPHHDSDLDQNLAYREREVPDLGLFQIFVEDPNGVTVDLNYWGADSKSA